MIPVDWNGNVIDKAKAEWLAFVLFLWNPKEKKELLKKFKQKLVESTWQREGEVVYFKSWSLGTEQ